MNYGLYNLLFSSFLSLRSLRWVVQIWFSFWWNISWLWSLGYPQSSGLEAKRPVLSGLASSTGAGKKSEYRYLIDKLVEYWQIISSSLLVLEEYLVSFCGQEQIGAVFLEISHYLKWSKEEQDKLQLKKPWRIAYFSIIILWSQNQIYIALSVCKVFFNKN